MKTAFFGFLLLILPKRLPRKLLVGSCLLSLLAPTLALGLTGEPSAESSDRFVGVRQAAQNGSTVGIVFQKSGARLAIFDFKSQALTFLRGPRFDPPARYSVLPVGQADLGWVNHTLPYKKIWVTNCRGIFKQQKGFFVYQNWLSSWQLDRVFSSDPKKSLFLMLKKWDKNQAMLAHYALDSENVYVVSREEWHPEITVFYDAQRSHLFWINRYSGQVDLRHPRTLKHQKTIRTGKALFEKPAPQPGRSKFHWRLEAPHLIEGQLYFQVNRYLDKNGERLEIPYRQAVRWDGLAWSSTKLYPLAFYRGEYLTFDRETGQLGLTADLNSPLTQAIRLEP